MSISCIPECQKTFCFGQFDCGEDITLPITAPAAGEYTLRADRLGKIDYVRATFLINAALVFPNPFNEDQDIYFTIVKPDGTLLTYTSDLVDYTHFEIQNRIADDLTP